MRHSIQAIAFVGVALALVVVACSDGDARECRVGADCASGACTPEGRCVREGTTPAPDASASNDAEPPGDASTDAPSDAALPGCSPNKDGVITREEIPIAAGLHATYRIGRNEDVSTAGTPAAGNKRAWDFSAPLASDVRVLVETQPLTGKWYGPKFSGATYAAKLREGSELIGVFQTSPGAFLLRGVVSPDEGLTKTELTNDPPVEVLKFPLKLAETWSTDTTVTGTAQGVFLVMPYSEKYESQIDAEGTLKTPLGTFDVLRVRVLLTRTVGLLTTRIRTFAFVTECYGTIATVTSADNETDVEFTRAVEIRRLSP
ncbi:MAG: hypothetical protein KF819_25390 [Labilithrix sp.]|nr:hypothetical protein [Labilithrix sp.]